MTLNMSTEHMDIYQPLPAGRRGLRRFGDLGKMTPLDFFKMYMVNLVDFHGFEASLIFVLQQVGNLFK